MRSKDTVETKVVTIKHTDVLTAERGQSIPPYEVSEWAKDKTTSEIHDEIKRRREEKRATAGFLDHEDLTLEMLWWESVGRSRRSAADVAAELTSDEQKRLAVAEARQREAYVAYLAAGEALSSLGSGQVVPGGGVIVELRPGMTARQAETVTTWDLAQRDLEDAQTNLTAVRGAIDARRQARRAGGQKEINRAGFLANLKRYGVELSKDVKTTMRQYYGRD